MNFKDIVVTLMIALAFTLGFQYFFSGKNTDADANARKSGRMFSAAQSYQEARPLQLNVDFLPESDVKAPIITTIETDLGIYEFSNHGAALQSLTFKEHKAETTRLMSTIDGSKGDKEQAAFLLALDTQTPYVYQLAGTSEDDEGYIVSYKAKAPACLVEKTFKVHKNNHRVDVTVSCTPKAGSEVRLRLLFPSPYMPTVSQDVVSALANDESGVLQKIARKKVETNRGWFSPTLFGSENKYFIHSLISDEQAFAQRAYFKPECDNLKAILETEDIKQPTRFNVSFYLGPKTEEAINAVDTRLSGALENSGWFIAPLSRLMLKILNLIYDYVKNYGFAIILLTLFLRLLLVPLSMSGQSSRKKQQEFQHKLTYIRQRYKNDPETLQREQAELVKKYGMPGLGMLAILLVQIPVFFAINRLLSSSVQLYQAPFLWISDLSATDPYYILPIIIALSFLGQALYADKSQRLTMATVGLVFGALSTNFSAGTALFVAVDGILRMVQSGLLGGM